MDYIKGEDRNQYIMFPNVLDDYIDENNPVRVIDSFIDCLNLKALGFSKAEISDTGRPPYSPRDLLKLYIYGYFNRIRSSRRLEKETKRNIELMWLLKKLTPDHKTISNFRKDNSKGIRNVFRSFVKLCDKAELYGKNLITIDGSKFAAVNSKDRNFNAKKIEDRLKRIDEKIEIYLNELDINDDSNVSVNSSDELLKVIESLNEKKLKYEEMSSFLIENQRTQISLTDPDSQRMNTANGSASMSYNIQTAVDDKNCLIAEFEVTNRPNDMGQLYNLASKCKEELNINNELTVLADKGYDSTTDIANCLVSGINANVCIEEESFDICIKTDEDYPKPIKHTNGRTVYLKEHNIVVCPMGEFLKPASYRKDRNCAKFYNSNACKQCKCRCVDKYIKTHEVRMPFEEFLKEYNIDGLKVKQINYKPDKELLKKRKCIAEHPFGVVKRCMDSDYFLTKRFKNVESEISLAYLVFNLKRAINLLSVNKLLSIIQTL